MSRKKSKSSPDRPALPADRPAPPADRPSPPGRRGRTLSSDEASLWANVAASVEGKKRGKARVRLGGDEGVAAVTPPPTRGDGLSAKLTPPPAAARTADAKLPPPPIPTPSPPKVKSPGLAEFDRRKVRHIARGKHDIDARLDLHGLRQSEARSQLLGFLHRAQDRGYRTVLVITGKGSGVAPDPLGHALGEPQRGVLRRLVPQWLESAELRALVISFTTASPRHGGDGALYVQIRRRDR